MQPSPSKPRAFPESLKRITLIEKPRFQVKSTSFDQSVRSSKASLKLQNSLNGSRQSIGIKYPSELNGSFERGTPRNRSQLRDKEYFAHSDSNICELLEIGNEFSAYPPRDASMRGFSKLEASNSGSRKQVTLTKAWDLEDEGPQNPKPALVPVEVLERKIQSATSAVVMTKKPTSRLTQEETDPLDFYEMGKLASAEMLRRQACYQSGPKGHPSVVKSLSKTSPILTGSGNLVSPAGREHMGKIPWKQKGPQDGHTFSPLKSRQYKLLMVEGYSKTGGASPLSQVRPVSTKKEQKPPQTSQPAKPSVSEDTPPTEATRSKGCFLLKKKKTKEEAAQGTHSLKDGLDYAIFNRQTPEALESKITRILQKDDSNLRNIYFMGMLRKLCRVQQTHQSKGENSCRSRRSSRQPSQDTEIFGVLGKKSVSSPGTSIKTPVASLQKSPDVVVRSRAGAPSNSVTYQNLAAASFTESLTYLQEVAVKQSLAKRSFDLKVSQSRLSSLDKSGPRKQPESKKMRVSPKLYANREPANVPPTLVSGSSKRRIKIISSAD